MSSRNPHEPSCTECRTRKAKCSKERPSCDHCVAAGRECIYLPRTTRTPLTRAHLDGVEERLNRFESAFKALFPSGDVNQVVNALIQDHPPQDPRSFESRLIDTQFELSSEPSQRSEERSNSVEDAVPKNTGLIPPSAVHGGVSTDPLSQGAAPGAALPPTPSAVLTLQTADEAFLVNSYFSKYHPSHPFVDEQCFRRIHQALAPDSQSIAWRVLCKAVMAMGAWCQCDTTCEVDINLYLQAQTMLAQMSIIESGDLTLIQALLLLSDFAQKRGSPEMGMQYLGIAVQKAVTLGLHREPSQSVLSPLEQEMRRRVWWSLYVFDSCAAKSFGRPLMLPDDRFMNVKPLLNIVPDHLSPTDNTMPTEADGPTIYSGLIAQTDFHRTANRIYRYLVANSPVSLKQVTELEGQVDDWQKRYPPYLPRIPSADAPDWLKLVNDRLVICDKNLRLLILRPFLMRWATMAGAGSDSAFPPSSLDIEIECAVRCIIIASEVMALSLERLQQPQYSRLGASFLLYCLFHGILIHLTFLRSGTPLPNESQFLNGIRATKKLLSHSWFGADSQSAHWLEVIRTLCEPFDSENGIE